jgi:FkbM family methyltransferase
MIRHGDFWWPDDDTDAHGVILTDVETAVPRLLEHFPGRRCIIQAGGNVGVYPKALATLFGKVITAEPDRANIDCLWLNLADAPNVDSRMAAFGEDMGDCRVVEVHRGNCGAHRVEPGGGVVMLTIDSLGVDPDCIWLDIEGFELFALKGAEQTIRRCHPVICTEEKGLGEAYGVRPEAIQIWLGELGYRRADRIGRDTVYV